VGALGTGRVPGLFRMSCLRGACCEPFRSDLMQPFPPAVRYVCVYSRTDGIVDWRACLDGSADEHVEIHASHCGMAVNPGAYERVARALAAFDEPLPRAA
jgi:triacylglycerol lipase